jgi:hypothetical protein
MSTVTYRYEQNYSFLKKGVKNTIKEQVIDGPKGLSVMFLKKEGDNFYKLYAKETEKDKIVVQEKEGNTDKPEQIVTLKELLKILKTQKLDSIINYISKERGMYKGKPMSGKKILIGGYSEKKSSKKTSKKGSKK